MSKRTGNEHPLLRSGGLAIVLTIVFVVTLVPYLLTMCPTFSFFDKGELAASSVTLGIPHPTGYPTFMMIGWLFSNTLSIFGARNIVGLNILAAVLVSLSAVLMTLLFRDLLVRFATAEKSNSVARATLTQSCLAALAALVVAFSRTWFSTANGFEVYSLHVFMLVLLTYTFLRFVDADTPIRMQGNSKPTRAGIVFAVLLGLSFTNHLTTILLAPGFLYYYFRTIGMRPHVFVGLLRLSVWFVVGLLPYLYLPIRSMMNAPINHTRPDTPARFMYHVLGVGFGDRMFSSYEVFRQQFYYFINQIPYEVGFVGLVLAAIGLYHAFRRNANLAVLFSATLVCTIVFACNYSIADIDSYFLAAVFAIGAFVLAGIDYIRIRFGAVVAGVAAVVTIGISLAVNYGPNDEHDNYLVEDLAYNMLRTLPEKSLLFTGGWAHWHAGSYYLQYAEGIRTDVVVIDPTFMTLTWYLQMLRTNHPDVADVVRPEMDRYIQLTVDNKSDSPADTLSADEARAYDAMVKALVQRSIQRRPVFVTHDIVKDIGQPYVRTPQALAYRLTNDSSYVPFDVPELRFRMWKRRIDPFAIGICETYARMMIERAAYEQQHGHTDIAVAYAKYSLTFDPQIDPAIVPDLPLADERKVIRMLTDFKANRERWGDK